MIVFAVAALCAAGAAFWALKAYRDAGGRRARGSLIVSGTAILIGLGIYLAIGRPELPDAPYEARLEALKGRNPASFTADEALAVLGRAARDNPRDAMAHFYSGRILLDLGRDAEAARAFDAALRRDPVLAPAMLGLGRAMVRMEQGRVTPEALALFQQLAPMTDDPAPWIYQAMAAMQEGRTDDARRFWREAYSRMSEDDPRREMAREQLSQ